MNIIFSAATSVGYKARFDRTLRPREMHRPTSHRAMDVGSALQRKHPCLAYGDAATGQEL